MGEITMYHVTDASNVDSVMSDGLEPGADDLLYLTETVEDAEFLGEVYDTMDDPVVLEVSVLECHIREGPGDAGEVEEYVKDGAIMPVDITVLEE